VKRLNLKLSILTPLITAMLWASLGSSTSVLALSAKNDLAPVGNFAISGENNSLVVNSKLGVEYIASSDNITVWSVANPTSPEAVGSVSSGAVKLAVAKSGAYLYAIGENGTLEVYSTGSSSSPTLTYVSSTPITGQQPDNMTLDGNYVYVVDWASTTAEPKIEIYNVANPSSPTEVAALGVNSDQLASPVGVSVNGKYAYITSDANGTLNVFNVAKPANPQFVSSVALTPGIYNNYSGEVAFSGDYAYVTGINANVVLISLI
jgi:hypothetical protein